MGNSLFNISSEYLDILEELEENGGELTPELEGLLSINKDELEKKLRSYFYVLQQHKFNEDYVKKEILRLKSKIESANKVDEKLKNRVLEALELFGNTGKTGNKKLDYPDFKVYTKSNFSISYNQELLDRFITDILDLTKPKLILEELDIYNLLTDVDISLNIPISKLSNILDILDNFKNEDGTPCFKISISINKSNAKAILNTIDDNEKLIETPTQTNIFNNVNMEEIKRITSIYKQCVKTFDIKKEKSNSVIFK